MTQEIPRAQPPPELDTDKPWRWRCNPLRRPIDLLQAWLWLAVTVAVLAAAPVAMTLVGKGVDHSLRQTAHDQTHSRQRTTAVLVYDTPRHLEPGSDEAHHARYPAEVRYTDVTGRTRTAMADAPPGLPAGGTVQVWRDGAGELTDPPLTDGEIRSRTIGWVATAGIAVALTGAAAHAAIGLALKRRRIARWGKAWDDTAPRWTTSS